MLQTTVHSLFTVVRVSGAVVLLAYIGIDWSVRATLKGIDKIDIFWDDDE